MNEVPGKIEPEGGASGLSQPELSQEDRLRELQMILDVSRQVASMDSLDGVLDTLMSVAVDAVGADRGSLFLHDPATSELYSRIAQGMKRREIRIMDDVGIAGAAFHSGEGLIIHDAYADPRFNADVDRETGFKTQSILACPVRNARGEIIGVAQALNKVDGEFDAQDLAVLAGITTQCAITLQSMQLVEQMEASRKREVEFLNIVSEMTSELELTTLLRRVMAEATAMLDAERSTLFINDEKTGELFSHVGEGLDSMEIRLPNTAGIAGSVFTSGEAITIGTRKVFTDVDWAALDDLGWDVASAAGPTDYGDAPDAAAGTGTGNYQTRAADNGPSHVIVDGLFIGTSVDGDDGTLHNTTASADDGQGTNDEDFVLSGALFAAEGQSAVININVTNTVGDATLYGWIDFDRDGVFEPSEAALTPVPNGTSNGTVSLIFTASGTGTAGSTFARFRLSTDDAAAAPTGAAIDGEVEDHQITVLPPQVAFDPLPLFNWSAVNGATRYELEVSNLSTGQVQISQPELVTNSFRPPAALPVGVFSWRHRAFVNGAFQAWSSPLSFAVLETGGTPFITDPVTSSVDSLPTIAWSPVLNATRYELWVNGTNKERAIHQTELTSASFTPRDGLPADTYTAWVRAFNGSTVLGGWSSPFTITLDSTGTSTLTEPIGSSTNTAPTFGWLPINTSRFTLQIDNLSTATDAVVFEPMLTGTSYTLPTGLEPGNYRATITGLGTTESQEIHFQVESVTGQTQFTMSSQRSENTLPTFSWTHVDTATRYELWVDDVTNGLTRVIHSSSLTDTAFKTTTPLPPARYRAWVRAFNGTSVIGTWSQSIDYVVRESSAVPTVWGPIHETQNGAPTFTWSYVSGATHYELDLQDSNGLIIQTQQFIGTNSLTLMDALDPDTYVTTVRAYNGTTLLGTDSRRFYLTTNSTGAQLFGPAGEITQTRPSFTWSGVDSATRYILWVNDDTRNINRRILQSNLQTTSYTPDGSLLPGDYRAWVRAYNGATPIGPWTFASVFTVAEVTGVPSITSPVPNSSNTLPTIAWTSVTGAASYDIEIDDVTNGQNSFITASGLTETSFQPTTALTPGQYRVRVRSVDGGGTPSDFSSDFTLTVESATTAVLVSPTIGSSTASADVLFAWTSVAGTGRYELWVNNLTTSTSQVVYETNLQTVSFAPASNLPAGDYRAWVRAIAVDGTPGPWSMGVNFTITANTQDADGGALEQPGVLLAAVHLPELQVPHSAVRASAHSAAHSAGPSAARTAERDPVTASAALAAAADLPDNDAADATDDADAAAPARTLLAGDVSPSEDAEHDRELDVVLMELADGLIVLS